MPNSYFYECSFSSTPIIYFMNNFYSTTLYFFVLFSINSVYSQPGSPDQEFGNNGVVVSSFYIGHEEISSIQQLSEGKLLAVGNAENSQDGGMTILRYNLDGTIDESFGNTGHVITQFENGIAFANTSAVLPDGKLILGGSLNYPTSPALTDMALARYHPNGTLDSTFGVNGKVVTDIRDNDFIQEIIPLTDNKLIVAFISSNNITGLSDFMLCRYTSTGIIDSTFGINGIVIKDVLGNDDRISSIEQQTDGKLIVGGNVNTLTDQLIALARYNTDGILDSTFGFNGSVIIDLSFNSEYISSLAIQEDGKIIIGGFGYVGQNIVGFIARYQSNGLLDTGYGTNGMITVNLVNGLNTFNDLAIDSEGSVVACGNLYDGLTSSFLTVRYDSNGNPDIQFGDNGKVITTINGVNENASTIIQQSDGKLLIGGFTEVNSNREYVLLRYNSCDPVSAPTGNVNQHFCDSVLLTDLTVVGTNISWYDSPQGGSQLDSNYWITTNGYYYTSQKTNGCESDQRLQVSVEITPTPIDSLIVEELMLSAVQSNATYLWYDCASNSPINEATNQSFTSSGFGSYAVEIELNGCIVMSDCYTVIDFALYPNPATDIIILNSTIADIGAEYFIYNESGTLLLNEIIEEESTSIDISGLGSGIYSLRIGEDGVIVSFIVI